MKTIEDNALKQLFTDARTHSYWLDKPVEDDVLREVYELAKMGPTSANCSPMRVSFLKSKEAKEKLRDCLDKGNIDKTMSAPVTAIIAYDLAFFEQLPILFPHVDARSWFVGNPDYAFTAAFRNSSLQGGYFIMAARALGLDVGPMSGFNANKVDALFFPGGTIRSNFLCNLGYGDASKLHPRLHRLAFNEACEII